MGSERELSDMGDQNVQADPPRRSVLLAVMASAGIPFWVLTVANLVGDFGSGRID